MEYNNYTTPYQNPGAVMAQIESLVKSAFGKGLASVIMAEFPILSIVSIFMGGTAVRQSEDASAMALRNGVSAGGKCVAAKVLGKIGKILGIVMTCVWAFYIVYFIAMFGMIFSNM